MASPRIGLVLPLIGIVIVVAGFALRLNPLLVVVVAAISTALAAGHGIVDVIASFGKAFIDSRSVAVVWLALPVIGLLERSGLKERAGTLIPRSGAARDLDPARSFLRARAKAAQSPASLVNECHQ